MSIGVAFILGSVLGFGAAGGETVEIERTPDSCIRALDLAAEGFTLAGEGMGYAAEAFEAAAAFDVDGIVAAGERMREVSEQMSEAHPELRAASQDCRATA